MEFMELIVKGWPTCPREVIEDVYYGINAREICTPSTSLTINEKLSGDTFPVYLTKHPTIENAKRIHRVIEDLISPLLMKVLGEVTENAPLFINTIRLLVRSSMIDRVIQTLSTFITKPITPFSLLCCALLFDGVRKNYLRVNCWREIITVICYVIEEGFLEDIDPESFKKQQVDQNKREYLVSAGVLDVVEGFATAPENIISEVLKSCSALMKTKPSIAIIKFIKYLHTINEKRIEVQSVIVSLAQEVCLTCPQYANELSQDHWIKMSPLTQMNFYVSQIFKKIFN
ncbi:hypothetical protein EIN_229330 [Entamoeba invadens IP1]|uniref:Uncharacterized protein n=1 Tax=Entamoeba invadens IP1 TaxID=370355 RepID=A0A0A1U697_ENTIV|nr:hypothetical protein EIN_229330 [Entamoeba invadens IP1]ELP88410.1 hypothetical protein EIN_229330 [Entamoeba invadens IP1]|eukprot:XP_004255181.1 hypothetical protein EIN_229330 [Entamoeba invadens IP1]